MPLRLTPLTETPGPLLDADRPPEPPEEPLERRPLHAAAGEPADVVPVRQAHPTLGLLARDVRLGALALRVEGVELLVEPLATRLPRIDRTANRTAGLTVLGVRLLPGAAAHRFPPNRKNRKPLMWLPVTFFAMAESVR